MPQQQPTATGERLTATTESLGVETVCEPRADDTTGWRDRIERIESVITRYPWPTLLLALGVGYAVSRRILR
jgi:hypothetical protein